jgi:hypothetical protein
LNEIYQKNSDELVAYGLYKMQTAQGFAHLGDSQLYYLSLVFGLNTVELEKSF